MAYIVSDNFNLQSKAPNFVRDQFATVAAMKAFPETALDEGHISYCTGDGKTYQYKSGNAVDATTGKWREFGAGGGSVTVKSPLVKNADGSVGMNIGSGFQVDANGNITLKPGTGLDADISGGAYVMYSGTQGLEADRNVGLKLKLGSGTPLYFQDGGLDIYLGKYDDPKGLKIDSGALTIRLDTMMYCGLTVTPNGLKIDTVTLGSILANDAETYRKCLGITSNGSINFQ